MAVSPVEGFQGPSLIGLAINIFMHGLSTLQMYLYYTSYKKDRLWLKSLVMILYSLDTFHCAVTTYYIYNVLVINFGNEASLLRGSWALAAAAASTGLVSVAVQHFFAWRVHVLTKNVFVVAAIVLCSLANLAGSLGAAVSLAINPSIFLVPDLQIEVTIWLVGAVLADTIIAAALVWHLGRHKHLYPALTSTINRILRMTVQTGLVTTIVAIINLVCYLSNSMGAYAVFSMILSKLYTNCMLSTLNARKAWKYEGSSDSEASHGNGDHSGVVVFQMQRTQPEVFVQVESYQKTDTDEKPAQDMQYL
ncbi:hypothetical protein EDD17DRAFT_473489 [Pisolithus thermaeus]|nr:hypothetical protein EV401DRAFT_1991005 [Pisolithus croceorrhizus]KAI6163487.1 hypothetical protein EDD17DRAFT_473489 [Pisolithus thermaeus]